jgi:hypothetical protein
MDTPRERLKRFIEACGGPAPAAEKIGCHRSYLSHLARDERRSVGLNFAVALERATAGWGEGQIAANEWVDTPALAPTGTEG